MAFSIQCLVSKGRAVGSVGRCSCISVSRFDVGEMMFAVDKKNNYRAQESQLPDYKKILT